MSSLSPSIQLDYLGPKQEPARSAADIPISSPPTSYYSFRAPKPSTPIPVTGRTVIFIACIISAFVAGMSTTSSVTIIPYLGEQYWNMRSICWVLTAYLTGAVALVMSVSKLADIFGLRYTTLVFYTFFIAGSAMSGASNGLGLLIAGRAVSGIGAAGVLMFPLIIVTRLVDDKQIHKQSLDVVMVTGIAGFAFGPLIGGGLAEGANWRWVFYINLPLIVPVTIALVCFLDSKRTKGDIPKLVLQKIDVLGILSLSGSLITFLLALDYGASIKGWSSGVVITMFILAAVFYVMFSFAELKLAKEPMIPRGVAKGRSCLSALIIQFLHGALTFAPLFLLSVWYRIVNGVGAKEIGIRLTPLTMCAFVAAVVSAIACNFVYRKHHRIVAWAAGVIVTAGSALLLLFDKLDLSRGSQVGIVIVLGIGIGLSAFVYAVSILPTLGAGFSQAEAAALWLFFQMMGGVVLIGVLWVVIECLVKIKLVSVSVYHPLFINYIVEAGNNPRIILLPRVPGSTKDAIRQAYIDTIKKAWIVLLVLAGVALLLSFFVKSERLDPANKGQKEPSRKEENSESQDNNH